MVLTPVASVSCLHYCWLWALMVGTLDFVCFIQIFCYLLESNFGKLLDSLRCVVYFYARLKVILCNKQTFREGYVLKVGCSYVYLNRPVGAIRV